jgi:hypothetical protein
MVLIGDAPRHLAGDLFVLQEFGAQNFEGIREPTPAPIRPRSAAIVVLASSKNRLVLGAGARSGDGSGKKHASRAAWGACGPFASTSHHRNKPIQPSSFAAPESAD